MSSPSARGPVATAAGTAALGALLLDVARTAETTTTTVMAVMGAVAAVLAVAGLLRGDRFEARLTAAVVAGASTLLAVIGMALGPPGTFGGGLSVRGVLVAVAGVTVLVLLRLPARRSPAATPPTRPYAR
ncbi:hypothetical protein LL946_04090 [Knoellia locipacati]|uniref:hypothetical protein n=1 Tax=Knoellia locipacati TaxID=882824 RepID=UPI00384E669F